MLQLSPLLNQGWRPFCLPLLNLFYFCLLSFLTCFSVLSLDVFLLFKCISNAIFNVFNVIVCPCIALTANLHINLPCLVRRGCWSQLRCLKNSMVLWGESANRANLQLQQSIFRNLSGKFKHHRELRQSSRRTSGGKLENITSIKYDSVSPKSVIDQGCYMP